MARRSAARSRTLKNELTDTNDLEALRAAFEAVRRFPAQRIWLLECDPDDAQVGEQSQLPGELVHEELNVLGTPTGVVTYATKRQPLPAAPLGFTWRKVVDSA